MAYFKQVTEKVEDLVPLIDEWGGPSTFPHMAAGWAVAFDAPFSWTKQVAYVAFLRDYRGAMLDLQRRYVRVLVMGLYWDQGDSDRPKANDYAKNLRSLFAALRKDTEIPDLQIFVRKHLFQYGTKAPRRSSTHRLRFPKEILTPTCSTWTSARTKRIPKHGPGPTRMDISAVRPTWNSRGEYSQRKNKIMTRVFRRMVLLLLYLCALSGMPAMAARGASPQSDGLAFEDVVVLGKDLSDKSSNVVPVESRFSGLVVCHGEGGFEQWTATIERAGPFFIHFRYCSGLSRPCRLLINGQLDEASALGEVTGGFHAEQLTWKTYGPFDLRMGDNTIRVETDDRMPHVMGLVVSANKATPRDDIFQRPSLKKIEEQAPLDEVKESASGRAELRKLLPDVGFILFIRRNTCTADHYYTDHVNDRSAPGGNLCVLNLRDGTATELAPEMAGGWFGRFDISFDAKKIVFGWKRSAKTGYRIYEIEIDPSTGLRAKSAGPRQLTFPADNEAQLVRTYGKSRGGHWYHHGTDDMHPCYLPDGRIAFVSTRCQYGILCNNDDVFTTTLLYRMDADGRNMIKLSNSAVSESSPCVMPDGRILYTRWEYVDKGHIGAKCLWAMKPDGSGSVEIYGNDISYPPTFIYGRPIPGKADQYVFLGTPHCFPNSIGTVIRVDTKMNSRTREPMTYITPRVDIRTEKGYWYRDSSGEWLHDNDGKGPLYKDPYPLSDKLFLVAHKEAGPRWDDASAYGLYLLDDSGEVRLVHKDSTSSCWQPYPLRARPRPPVLPPSVDGAMAKKQQAVCVVTDVYHGLRDIPRGTVKYIRILEQVPRPWSARRTDGSDKHGKAHVVLSNRTVLGLKVLRGIVPVEEDGSANFVVPSGRNIYFQVLDKNLLAVQSERTYVNYRPGETRACIGCHETPNNDVPGLSLRATMALQRAPSAPAAQPGDATASRTLHYPADVQPVLDRHCVKCHGPKKKDGGLDLTGRPTGLFSVSYEALMSKIDQQRWARLKEGYKESVEYLPSRSCYSYGTTLVAMLARGEVRLADKTLAKRAEELAAKHKEVALSPGELLKISTWIDANCQYYGSYWGRRHVKFSSAGDFRPNVTFEQAISTVLPEIAKQ